MNYEILDQFDMNLQRNSYGHVEYLLIPTLDLKVNLYDNTVLCRVPGGRRRMSLIRGEEGKMFERRRPRSNAKGMGWEQFALTLQGPYKDKIMISARYQAYGKLWCRKVRGEKPRSYHKRQIFHSYPSPQEMMDGLYEWYLQAASASNGVSSPDESQGPSMTRSSTLKSLRSESSSADLLKPSNQK